MTEPPFDVIYLDNHLLVVGKPAGMLSQGDATGDADLVTLAKAYLKERFDKPGNVFCGLVHRLDRPAAGLVVLARTSKAAGRLSDQFRKRTVGKRYLAVVEGQIDGEGRCIDWLAKGRGTVRRVKEGAAGAKRAELTWAARAIVGKRTLIEVDLITGRPHQIRVQLAHLVGPIVGDLRYGASEPMGDGRGLALLSASLEIDHPTKGERMRWTASPPDVWPGALREPTERALAALRATALGQPSA